MPVFCRHLFFDPHGLRPWLIEIFGKPWSSFVSLNDSLNNWLSARRVPFHRRLLPTLKFS